MLRDHWLQRAAGKGDDAVVERQLVANANVNAAPDIYGLTALQAAADGGHLDVVKRLLAANADVNAPSYDGRTALQAAARHEVVMMVLQAAAGR